MLSNLIKKKAEDKGLSINKLEKKAGLRPGGVYNILSGRSKNPSIFIVQSIANALNCSVTDFIEADETLNNKKQMVRESHISWDSELYFICVSYLIETLKNKKVVLAKEEFMKLADEIYFYSAKVGASDVDKRFVDWILDKSLNA